MAPNPPQPPLLSTPPHQGGMFVTIDEHPLTHRNHPEPTVALGSLRGVARSMHLGECMACTHGWSIIQCSFTALKILCASHIHPSLFKGYNKIFKLFC